MHRSRYQHRFLIFRVASTLSRRCLLSRMLLCICRVSQQLQYVTLRAAYWTTHMTLWRCCACSTERLAYAYALINPPLEASKSRFFMCLQHGFCCSSCAWACCGRHSASVLLRIPCLPSERSRPPPLTGPRPRETSPVWFWALTVTPPCL